MDTDMHQGHPGASGVAAIEDLMASAVQLPTQAARPNRWSAEKQLAAAVLGGALLELRERRDDELGRRRAEESLAWIDSDEVDWPFSFVRLCEVFDLEPAWVRAAVRRWQAEARETGRRSRPRYRHAA